MKSVYVYIYMWVWCVSIHMVSNLKGMYKRGNLEGFVLALTFVCRMKSIFFTNSTIL